MRQRKPQHGLEISKRCNKGAQVQGTFYKASYSGAFYMFLHAIILADDVTFSTASQELPPLYNNMF